MSGTDSAGNAAGGADRRRRPRTKVDSPAGMGTQTGAAGGARPGAGDPWSGFWLPAPLRERLINKDTVWQSATFSRGRPCDAECPPDAPGAVTVRWPAFGPDEWAEVLAELRAARDKAPRGPEYWARLQAALSAAAGRLADPADAQTKALFAALSGYTGYSPGMMAAALGVPGLWDLGQMVPALRYQPDKVCGVRWREIPGLPGRVRFYPRKPFDKAAGWIPIAWEMPLHSADIRPRTVLGLGAGNIPGSTLRMLLLALSTTLRGEAPLSRPEPPPAVLIRESIREPILTPYLLAAIEEVDPDLVSMVAAGIWDHDDPRRQERLVGQADLVMAADEDHPGPADPAASRPRALRLHMHGPRVGFTVISREVLEAGPIADVRGWALPVDTEIIDVVALLAGLDSALWDQNGTFSSRIHFVEKGGPADDFPAEYARHLIRRLRQIDEVMPRGAWPLRYLHEPFDRYKAIEGSDRWGTGLQVISDYDDPFVVVLDERIGKDGHADPDVFTAMVADCRTRVMIVRPVDDLMEVPWRYLALLPQESLQSVCVAFGRPGEGVTKQLLDFATACGRQGVTAIRTVGRAAFPRLAYSWDGLLPLDLVATRASGYFTTIESEAPFDEMMATYRAVLAQLAKLPTAPGNAGTFSP